MRRALKKSGLGIGALLDRLHRRLWQDPSRRDPDEIDMIIVTGDGVIVNDRYIDKERIEEIIDNVLKEEIQRGARGLGDCDEFIFRLPELGVVVRRESGGIQIGGIEIQRKSWLYQEISRLFVQQRIR